MKRHPTYHGDLAKVISSDPDKDGKYVEVIIKPRIDFAKISSQLTSPSGGLAAFQRNRKKGVRPVARAFDPKEVEGRGGQVYRTRKGETNNSFYQFNEEWYQDGYLVKKFLKASLFTGADVSPTLIEIQDFHATGAAVKHEGEEERSTYFPRCYICIFGELIFFFNHDKYRLPCAWD